MVREWLPELWFEKPFLQNIKPLKPGLPVPKCANFEKDFYKCAEGIGQKRAQTECRLQIEDLKECASGSKHRERRRIILKQRAKLIREGKYKIPDSPKTCMV